MCGVFGIYGHPEGLKLTRMAAAMLKHRGKDAFGIGGYSHLDPLTIKVVKRHGTALGVPLEELEREEILGGVCMAHTRWATRELHTTSSREIHPHYVSGNFGKIALAHNGDVKNIQQCRDFLSSRFRLYSKNDAELIAAIIMHYANEEHGNDFVRAIFSMMDGVAGAYAAVMMTEFDKALYAFCDPLGIRPLVYMQVRERDLVYHMVASEDCVTKKVFEEMLAGRSGESHILEERWLAAGEVLRISDDGVQSSKYESSSVDEGRPCLFERVYISKPNSTDHAGVSFSVRRRIAGAALAKEHPVPRTSDTIVVPIPKGGIPAAEAYSAMLNIPTVYAILISDWYTMNGGDRTFIDKNPQEKASNKYDVIPDLVRGKIVVIVDDSVVRGTTASRLVKQLREAGVKEVHFRIPSPPYRHPCDLGVETRNPERLVAALAKGDVSQMRQYIGQPDSIAFLSLERLKEASGGGSFCDHCFSGKHPLAGKSYSFHQRPKHRL